MADAPPSAVPWPGQTSSPWTQPPPPPISPLDLRCCLALLQLPGANHRLSPFSLSLSLERQHFPAAHPWWSPPNLLCALQFPLHHSSFLSHELHPSQKYLISRPDLAARVHPRCCPGKGCKYKHLGCLFGCTLFLVGGLSGRPAFAVPPSRAFFSFANQIVGKAAGNLGSAGKHPSHPQPSPMPGWRRTRASSSATGHVKRSSAAHGELCANGCRVLEAELDPQGCGGPRNAAVWSLGTQCHGQANQENGEKRVTPSKVMARVPDHLPSLTPGAMPCPDTPPS